MDHLTLLHLVCVRKASPSAEQDKQIVSATRSPLSPSVNSEVGHVDVDLDVYAGAAVGVCAFVGASVDD